MPSAKNPPEKEALEEEQWVSRRIREAAWRLCSDANLEPVDYDTLRCLVLQTEKADWRKGRAPEALYLPTQIASVTRTDRKTASESVARLGKAGIIRRVEGKGNALDLSPIRDAADDGLGL